MKVLIINADDFGLCSGVNKAIIEAHLQGVVTSASLMGNMPGFDEAVHLVRLNPSLDLGIHLTLAAGRPVSSPEEIPSLVDRNGRFLERRTLLMRLLKGGIRRSDIEEETHAQVKKFLQTGLRPFHINGDQHVHMFPVVRDAVIDVARNLGIAVRIPAEKLLWRKAPIKVASLNPSRFFLKIGLRIFSHSLRRLCRTWQIPTNDHFISIFGFFPRRPPCPKDLLKLIDSVGNGVTELMAHPAFMEEAVVQFWGGDRDLSFDREREFDALVSKQFRESISLAGIVLGSYSRLCDAS